MFAAIRLPAAGATLATCAVMLAAAGTGCDLPLYRATETISEVLSTGEAPQIIVETFNGSIDVSNGQSDEVVVEVTKHAAGADQAAAEANLEQIDVSITGDAHEVRVLVKRIGKARGNQGGSVVLAAPPGSSLILKSSNGYIVSEGMRGGLQAKTSNAKIDVVDATGQINIATSNGPILIEAEEALVDARTSNAGLRLRGSLTDGDHKLTTSNGPVAATLPADSSFRFQASTSNGSIDCDFDFQETDSKKRRRKAGVVGDSPRFTLDVSTSNSSVDIRKSK